MSSNEVIDLQSRPTLAARVRLQIDPASGNAVLLYPEGLVELNATAHEIVSRCDRSATVEQIVASLAAEFETSDDELCDDVLACLRELQRQSLITLTT